MDATIPQGESVAEGEDGAAGGAAAGGVAEIEAAQDEIIEEFGFFDDWMDRYQYLIDLGRGLADLPASEKTETHRIHGCQSQVWFVPEGREGRLHFRAISDSAIVSGIIAVILRIYSGRPPAAIAAAEPRFIAGIGLDRHLSPTRSNGLSAMLDHIRRLAAAQKAG